MGSRQYLCRGQTARQYGAVGQRALDGDGHHLLEGTASGEAQNVDDQYHPVAIAVPVTATSGVRHLSACVSNRRRHASAIGGICQ